MASAACSAMAKISQEVPENFWPQIWKPSRTEVKMMRARMESPAWRRLPLMTTSTPRARPAATGSRRVGSSRAAGALSGRRRSPSIIESSPMSSSARPSAM